MLNFSLTGKCFPLTGKCFPLTNFSNGKQTHESLESDFPETSFRETSFRETNTTLDYLLLLHGVSDEFKI